MIMLAEGNGATFCCLQIGRSRVFTFVNVDTLTTRCNLGGVISMTAMQNLMGQRYYAVRSVRKGAYFIELWVPVTEVG